MSELLWGTSEIETFCSEFAQCVDGNTQIDYGNIILSREIHFSEASLFRIDEIEESLAHLNSIRDIAVVSDVSSSLISAPCRTFTFEISKQRRPGAHHGRGGRPRALTGLTLEQSVIPKIAATYSRVLVQICGGSVSQVPAKIIDAAMTVRENEELSFEIHSDFELSLTSLLNGFITAGTNSSFEAIRGPFLAVCCKVPRAEISESGTRNAMDKHASCSWIDYFGCVHCTCIGSTLFRVNGPQLQTVDTASCAHFRGLSRVISAVATSLNVESRVAARVLARVSVTSSGVTLPEYTRILPKLYDTHKESIIVVAASESRTDPSQVLFVPVRHITKGSIRNVCAFCDNYIRGNCHHTRTISIIKQQSQEGPNGDAVSQEENTTRMGSHEEETKSISFLPLAAVNCAGALEKDQLVSRLCKASEPYILEAPRRCHSCESPRVESSRHVWTEGVLMCTIGPCRMHTEEFKCSSASCNSKITAEGRGDYVLVDKMTTAATHALLRRELHGVVISNDTLNGRLSQFHSLVTSHAYFGVIPSFPTCRSVRTLSKMCAVMLRLMSSSPSKSLFRCNTCDYDEQGNRRQRLHALCMDGIAQGYLKTSLSPFSNISEPCLPIRPSTNVTRGRSKARMRPLIGLVRESKPVSILVDAIRGNSLSCSSMTEKSFAAAIRIISSSAIPADFCSSYSVFGRSRGDVSEDAGEQSNLHRLRSFVTSVFDGDVLIYRLIVPLYRIQSRSAFAQHLRQVISTLEVHRIGISQLEGICWHKDVSRCSGHNVCNDIMNLFQMLLQGPLLQFVKKTDVHSLHVLSDICRFQSLQSLNSTLANPAILLQRAGQEQTNVLSSLRILKAGLFSVTEVERESSNSAMRQHVGEVLYSCKHIVVRFYDFYDRTNVHESAFVYRDRWEDRSVTTLRQHLAEMFAGQENESRLLEGTDLELALMTGTYFPDRPQVRPLPFNDEESCEDQFASVASCSKDFLQRQKSFTPGALTFCCSCTHPKILGFKVLHRNEGPRAIMDTVVSRFSAIPRHLVYYFCCGLFLTAIHCLW